MKNKHKWSFFAVLLAAVFAGSTTLLAAPPASEAELIADLSSSKDSKVTSALQHLEKEYPTSTNALPAICKLLTDPREAVRRKAARVLGSLHADISDADITSIGMLLKAKDPQEVIDGLKALRGLKAPQTVPDIIPLLQNPNPYVIRDSCRTLAVLGTKDNATAIEPLLHHPNPAVQKDAMDAIAALKAKP